MTPATWGLVGNQSAVASVSAAVAAQRVPHAWLITGPEGVGRTTLALALARALNCDAVEAERPCGQCRACHQITARTHPDVLVADMAWQTTMFGPASGDTSRARQRFSIEAIRALRQDIFTRPLLGRWKVLILDDAGLFSTEAPEAFLKTLEEPPAYAVIVLVAQSPEQVPETIRSRCRQVALGLIGRSEIQAELLRRGTDGILAERIARIARGRMAWALTMSQKPDALLARGEAIEAAYEHLVSALGRAAIVGVVAAGHTQRRDATFDLLNHWVGFWRDALYLRVGLAEQAYYPDITDRLIGWTQPFTLEEMHRALAATQRCLHDLDSNVQARIALQAMVMEWPG